MNVSKLKTFYFGVIFGMLILLSIAVTTYFVVTYVNKVKNSDTTYYTPSYTPKAPVKDVDKKPEPKTIPKKKNTAPSVYMVDGHTIGVKFVPKNHYKFDKQTNMFYDEVNDKETHTYIIGDSGVLKTVMILRQVDIRKESIRDVVTYMHKTYALPYVGRYTDRGLYLTNIGIGVLVTTQEEGYGIYTVSAVISSHPFN